MKMGTRIRLSTPILPPNARRSEGKSATSSRLHQDYRCTDIQATTLVAFCFLLALALYRLLSGIALVLPGGDCILPRTGDRIGKSSGFTRSLSLAVLGLWL